jgi:transcriptional regulator GlxA family with amidase domain
LGNKDTLIVCGGADARRSATLPVISWLRREARKGVSIGAFSGGSFALAKAGLLDGHRATVHWDSRDSFREDFPNVDLSDTLYVMDRKRFTTAGGISSIDLMLALIDQDGEAGLSTRIAGQMNYSGARSIQRSIRMSVSERVNVRHPTLVTAFALMESNLEDVLGSKEIATLVGLSCRQLERLFKAHLSQTPMSFYLELRLQRATQLLMETSMPIIEIALACGFESTSHFSRKFREMRGVSAVALRSGVARQ